MTGLTYSGHPLSCAAGVAAIESYEQENLISRSRTLGAALYARLRELQARHPLIGDVRGGDGLFAVLELVRDRVSRAPLAPWPELHPGIKALLQQGMAAGVSFAARGNLILLAPPLVIGERDLAQGLEVLDGLLANLARTLRTEGVA
jgi:taurine--2-oxoglutarate transaminase